MNYLSIKAKNNKEKDFLNVDCFEVGLIVLKCAVGDLLDEFLHLMVRAADQSVCFNKELFLTAKESASVSEKNKIDVFRILDNYPIRDLNLIITDKLCEHYSSFFKFLLGELRDFTGPKAPRKPDAGQELQHVVLRGGIAYERMTLAWLDDVLATLHRLGAER